MLVKIQVSVIKESTRPIPDVEIVKRYIDSHNINTPDVNNVSPMTAINAKHNFVINMISDKTIQSMCKNTISVVDRVLNRINLFAVELQKSAGDQENTFFAKSIEALSEIYIKYHRNIKGIENDDLDAANLQTAEIACFYEKSIPAIHMETHNMIDGIMQSLRHNTEENDENIVSLKNKCRTILESVDTLYKDKRSLYEISELGDILTKIDATSLFSSVLDAVMKDIHMVDGKLDPANSYTFTSYIVLWIALYYRTEPGRETHSLSYDRLIMVDEAQTLMPMEIELLRRINYNVKLNLFGDVYQHVQDEKGMDKWPTEKFEKYDFKYYCLENNYRNAEPITRYCNEKLGFNMLPIGLSGEEVDEITVKTWSEAGNAICERLEKRNKDMRVAVIYRESSINDSLKKIRDIYDCNVIDNNNCNISNEKVNLVRVKYVKGIEFDEVIVVNSGKFSKEELYIAYTRALSKLNIINIDKAIAKIEETKTIDSENITENVAEENRNNVASIGIITGEKDHKVKATSSVNGVSARSNGKKYFKKFFSKAMWKKNRKLQ
jgi:hypothetical protein